MLLSIMVVRMRSTRGHRDNRRANQKLTAAGLVPCSNCKALRPSHRVCAACGYYKGVRVLDFSRNIKRKEEKQKERSKAGA